MTGGKSGSLLAELMIGSAVLALVSSMLVVRAQNSREDEKIAVLRANWRSLQRALEDYREDHGFYPCQAGDANRRADPVVFRRQLTWHTDSTGRVAARPDSAHQHGPYIRAFPENPLACTDSEASGLAVLVDTLHHGITLGVLDSLAQRVKGWYYLARTGKILPIPGYNAIAEIESDSP